MCATFFMACRPKSMKHKLISLTILLFTFLSGFSQSGPWELLGEKLVNDRLDHDVVVVTAAKGDFKKIQIRVKGASVDFHKVIITYGNGKTEEIPLRHTIPAGGSSRIIDLAGHDRYIRSIEFWYDANTIRGRKAKVRVFGRH